MMEISESLRERSARDAVERCPPSENSSASESITISRTGISVDLEGDDDDEEVDGEGSCWRSSATLVERTNCSISTDLVSMVRMLERSQEREEHSKGCRSMSSKRRGVGKEECVRK